MSVDPGLSASVEGPPVHPPGPAVPAQVRQKAAQRAAQPRRRPSVPATGAAPGPGSAPPAQRPRGARPPAVGRRVKRIVRRIDLWSVLKVALVFNTIMLVICLGAVAVLWALASTTGLVDDLEGFLRDSGFEDFRFDGDRMFTQVAFVGAVLTLASTVMLVLATALLNLISEMTGGIRFTVIEEVVDVRTTPSPPPVAATPPAPPAPPRMRRPAPAPGPTTPSPTPVAGAAPVAATPAPGGPGGSSAGGIAR